MQPRGRECRAPRRLPRRRGDAHELRGPVDEPAGPGRPRAPPRDRRPARGGRRRARRRVRHLEHGPHRRQPRRDPGGRRAHARGPHHARAPAAARELLRAHPRAGHAARRRPGAPPRRGRDRRRLRPGRRRPWRRRATEWEEISNWARPGHECRHNHLYWDQGDYAGLRVGRAQPPPGAGARGTCARPTATSRSSREGRDPLGGEESLDDAHAALRARSRCALRTRRGVAVRRVRRRSTRSRTSSTSRTAACALNARGRLLANQVILRLGPRRTGPVALRRWPRMTTTSWTRSSNLTKRRGFIFPSAEIYGGFRSTYDYGPLGVNMLRNVQARRGGARWSSCATTSSAWTRRSSARRRCGRRRATWRPSPTRWSTAASARSAGAPTRSTASAPTAGRREFTEPRAFNLMFKTPPARSRARARPPTCAPRRPRGCSSTSPTS